MGFPFPLEKILTIDAINWAKINKKDLNGYEARGVHYHHNGPHDGPFIAGVGDFAKQVPREADVVVGYEFSISDEGYQFQASGTALIPKKTYECSD